MFNPFDTATIQSLASAAKNLDISHAKLHYKSNYLKTDGTKIIMNYTSIIDEYYDFLQSIIVEVTLTDEEFANYKFQPKRLSMDYYQTTELWSAIMRINNITSISQFTKQKLKLFTQDIFDVLNEILILEEDDLKENRIDNYGK